MFSHITVGSNDLEKGQAFYDAVFAPLGIKALHVFPGYGAGYGTSDNAPTFWLLRPHNQQAASVGNGGTVVFLAPSRKNVDEFYKAALTHGGKDEGAPGLRPNFGPNIYAAYVRDVDGNKLGCWCKAAE
jgi:catechol 2,3-dioxygenase-like lactoylglutathione lyase family enzyme